VDEGPFVEVDAARMLKPKIPFIGSDGIPIRDEIELEIAQIDASRD
jgi:hypothetical protein